MSAQAIVSIVCLAVIVGAAVGYFCGISRGRALQWCDDYFEGVDRERAKRDRFGRFAPKGRQ